jgi:hypothetical protein
MNKSVGNRGNKRTGGAVGSEPVLGPDQGLERPAAQRACVVRSAVRLRPRRTRALFSITQNGLLSSSWSWLMVVPILTSSVSALKSHLFYLPGGTVCTYITDPLT